ncbi:MAG: hypothetical protein IPK93_05320 [Solirubrobacterales bacterium]|nr:hypothetical protein [Solirubrobacterales bacterium]
MLILTPVFETYGISVASGNPGLSKVSLEALQTALSIGQKWICNFTAALEEWLHLACSQGEEQDIPEQQEADPDEESLC